MRLSPANRPKPVNQRSPRSISTLAALWALMATAALVPSPATAADDATPLGICAPSNDAPGEMDFNGYEWCAVDQAGGGASSAPSLGVQPATGGHEVIRAIGVLPKPPADPISACAKRLDSCLRPDRGSGRQWADRDGPGRGGARGGGQGPAGKRETSKRQGKPKLTPKQECQELEVVGLIWSPSQVVTAIRDGLWDKRNALRDKLGRLGMDLAKAQKSKSLGGDPNAVPIIEREIGAVEREAVAVEREMSAIYDARDQWEKKKCSRLLYDV